MSRSGKSALPANLRVIFLMRTHRGYRGMYHNCDKYVYFNFGEKTGLKTSMEYDAADFQSMEHFRGMISRFASPVFFPEKPVEVSALTAEELDRVYECFVLGANCKAGGSRFRSGKSRRK